MVEATSVNSFKNLVDRHVRNTGSYDDYKYKPEVELQYCTNKSLTWESGHNGLRLAISRRSVSYTLAMGYLAHDNVFENMLQLMRFGVYFDLILKTSDQWRSEGNWRGGGGGLSF